MIGSFEAQVGLIDPPDWLPAALTPSKAQQGIGGSLVLQCGRYM